MSVPALSILHCCVNVPDMDEALVFFRDLLGFEVAAQGKHKQGEVGPLLAMHDIDVLVAIVTLPDGTEIELLEFRRPLGTAADARTFEDVGISVLTLIVDDVEATARTLAEHGYPAHGEIVPFEGPERDLVAVHVHGPGGIPLTLGEWRAHA
jgi:catechol 2,3-dioxygenase-like lactoylglutathione lyase family enzyme